MDNYLDTTKFKTCTCGETVESNTTEVKYKFGFIGWFFWSMGTTAIPKKVLFYCRKCSTRFETLTNREQIKYYIFYKKH